MKYLVLRDNYGFQGLFWTEGQIAEFPADVKPPHHFQPIIENEPDSSMIVSKPVVREAIPGQPATHEPDPVPPPRCADEPKPQHRKRRKKKIPRKGKKLSGRAVPDSSALPGNSGEIE